jgi:hypothetical protein
VSFWSSPCALVVVAVHLDLLRERDADGDRMGIAVGLWR